MKPTTFRDLIERFKDIGDFAEAAGVSVEYARVLRTRNAVTSDPYWANLVDNAARFPAAAGGQVEITAADLGAAELARVREKIAARRRVAEPELDLQGAAE